MKIFYRILVSLLIGLSFAMSSIAHAQWSALSSHYAITTDWHGTDVPLGQSVTAWAGTTDANITAVLFRWSRPDNTTFANVTVYSLSNYTTPNVPAGVPQEIRDWASNHTGVTVYYANNTQVPDTENDWGVQAFFIGPDGKTKASVEDTVAIRATSFNAVPDLPVVGTAGAIITMLLGLGLFLQKKK